MADLRQKVERLAKGQAMSCLLIAEAFPMRASTQASSSHGSGAAATKHRADKEADRREIDKRRKDEKVLFKSRVEEYYEVMPSLKTRIRCFAW